ncbi:MAG: substrate-binding domain-containing protein [Bacteroidia bacterium]|nr:substrate-binding domain-containing protein [Bacteroidia bacterium]
MKQESYVIIMACWIILTGCGAHTSSSSNSDTNIDLVSSRDSVGILGYTSSGKLDKPVPASESSTSGSITIAVDEALQPIIDAEIEAFQFRYPTATIHPLYLPGEEAIAAMLSSDSVRMAISSRVLAPEEEAFLAKRGIEPSYSHLFSDATALINHPGNSLHKLTGEQLRGILTGTIKTWNQLDSKLPAKPVELIFDNRASSILTDLRKQYLEGEPIPSQSVFAFQTTPEVVDHVASHEWAIGFIGFAWISDQDNPQTKIWREAVTLMALEKSEESKSTCFFDQNFFLPFQSYIYEGCYPLTRKATSILRESTLGLGTGFVSFIDSEIGQLVIQKAGLVTVHGVGREVKLPAKVKIPKQDKLSSPE